MKILPLYRQCLFRDPAKQTEMWHQLFVTWHLVTNVQVKIEYRWFKYFSITSKCHAGIEHIPDFYNCMFYGFIFSALTGTVSWPDLLPPMEGSHGSTPKGKADGEEGLI